MKLYIPVERDILWLVGSSNDLYCLFCVSPSLKPYYPWEIVWESEITISQTQFKSQCNSISISNNNNNNILINLSELLLKCLKCVLMKENLPTFNPSKDSKCNEMIEWIGMINYESISFSISSISSLNSEINIIKEMMNKEYDLFLEDKDMFESNMVYYYKRLHEKQRSNKDEEIMNKLELMNNKLERIDNNIMKLTEGLSKGFVDIRNEMMKLNNVERLKEIKDLWMERVNQLENSLKLSTCDEKRLCVIMKNLEKGLLMKMNGLNGEIKNEMIKELKLIQNKLENIELNYNLT